MRYVNGTIRGQPDRARYHRSKILPRPEIGHHGPQGQPYNLNSLNINREGKIYV